MTDWELGMKQATEVYVGVIHGYAAENAKLRERIEELEGCAVAPPLEEQLLSALDENAKLRELAENLLMALTVLETPEEQRKCIDRALDLRRELGVLPMETFDARKLGIEEDE